MDIHTKATVLGKHADAIILVANTLDMEPKALSVFITFLRKALDNTLTIVDIADDVSQQGLNGLNQMSKDVVVIWIRGYVAESAETDDLRVAIMTMIDTFYALFRLL